MVDLRTAEPGQMVGQPLDIEQGKVLASQMLDKSDEGDFRGIGLDVKHRLTEKGPPEGYAVKPSRKIIFIPAFDAVGIAGPMESAVTVDDGIVYPGLFPSGTGADHLLEGFVDGESESSLTDSGS